MSNLASAITQAAPIPLAAQTAQFWNQIQRVYNSLQSILQAGTNLVWNNPNATPQQVVAAFGTNAASLFQLSSLLCGLIGSVTGTTPNPVPAGWTITASADGTITLTPPTAS